MPKRAHCTHTHAVLCMTSMSPPATAAPGCAGPRVDRLSLCSNVRYLQGLTGWTCAVLCSDVLCCAAPRVDRLDLCSDVRYLGPSCTLAATCNTAGLNATATTTNNTNTSLNLATCADGSHIILTPSGLKCAQTLSECRDVHRRCVAWGTGRDAPV